MAGRGLPIFVMVEEAPANLGLEEFSSVSIIPFGRDEGESMGISAITDRLLNVGVA
jgi:hypothetical protein